MNKQNPAISESMCLPPAKLDLLFQKSISSSMTGIWTPPGEKNSYCQNLQSMTEKRKLSKDSQCNALWLPVACSIRSQIIILEIQSGMPSLAPCPVEYCEHCSGDRNCCDQLKIKNYHSLMHLWSIWANSQPALPASSILFIPMHCWHTVEKPNLIDHVPVGILSSDFRFIIKPGLPK